MADLRLGCSIVLVMALSSCEQPKTLGEECHPLRGECADWLECAPQCSTLQYACLPHSAPIFMPPDMLGCSVDGLCRPEACESIWNCREDCGMQCDVPALAALPPTEFIVSAIRVGRARETLESFSLDLDGDDHENNSLGWGLDFLADNGYLTDPNHALAESINRGEWVVAVRVYPGAGLGLVQLLMARMEGYVLPGFIGNDRLVLAPEASTDASLCAGWTVLQPSDPGSETFELPLPVPDASGLLPIVPLAGARVQVRFAPAGFQDLIVAGGIRVSEVRPRILAVVMRNISRALIEDPNGNLATNALHEFDGCPGMPTSIAGCEAVVAGQGECAQDGVVTETEVRCHWFSMLVIVDDLPPLPGETERRISFGMRIDAVPAVIVE